MIPAGLEIKKKANTSYNNNYYEDSNDDYSDYSDDDEFYFGPDSNLNKNTVQYQNNINSNQTEINNNFYYQQQYDSSQYVLNDLKNAILQKNFELVTNLFDKHNLDVNCELDTKWTPLMYAVQASSYELSEYLIDKGADFSFSDEDSFSILMCACSSMESSLHTNNLLKICELILSKSRDPEVEVNSCDKYSQTPLMYACRSGNHFLIDCLVKYGASIDAVDDNNWTSLSHACSRGHLKCVQKLLQLNADPTIYSKDYFYPHDLAEKNMHFQVRDLIKRYLKFSKFKKTNELNDLFEKNTDESDDECYYESSFSPKKKHDDLETFLNNLKLSNLIQLFKSKKITLKILLNLNEDDLKAIGVSDLTAREIITNEIRKFHQKNWKSSSLVPIRNDFSLNSTEVISVMTNLARYIDFMSTNVKYITREAIEIDKEIFADRYLNMKFLNELDQASKNCNELMFYLKELTKKSDEKIKVKDTKPIDLIKPKSSQNRWSKSKKFALTTLCLGFVTSLSAYVYVKFKI